MWNRIIIKVYKMHFLEWGFNHSSSSSHPGFLFPVYFFQSSFCQFCLCSHRFRIASIYPFILIPSFHPQAQFIPSFLRPSSPDSPLSPFDFYVKGAREAEICFSPFLLPDFVLQTPNNGAMKTSEAQILHGRWKRNWKHSGPTGSCLIISRWGLFPNQTPLQSPT